MADIFVSYTSKDRDWAFWIGQELLKLGHTPHVHEWEISAGGDMHALDALQWPSHEQIRDGFPELTEDDIGACLAYAAERERRLITVSDVS